MGQMIEAFFDGVCEPTNPSGYAAYGVLIKVDGEVQHTGGAFVGRGSGMSNNVAEYAGMCAVLDWILNRNCLGVTIIRGDSKLVIEQLSGRWKVHGGAYVPYYEKAKHLLDVLQERTENNVKLVWIPREQNGECDKFSKAVLLRMGVKFRIQPDSVASTRS
jgi:ribonuclease H / adenosylcobalamin/alpha-ribazole phosphatase